MKKIGVLYAYMYIVDSRDKDHEIMSELLFKDKIAKLGEFEKDAAWYRRHYRFLKERYGGKYVAIRNGRVVHSDINRDRLLSKLGQRRSKDRAFVVKYISKRDLYPAP